MAASAMSYRESFDSPPLFRLTVGRGGECADGCVLGLDCGLSRCPETRNDHSPSIGSL